MRSYCMTKYYTFLNWWKKSLVTLRKWRRLKKGLGEITGLKVAC